MLVTGFEKPAELRRDYANDGHLSATREAEKLTENPPCHRLNHDYMYVYHRLLAEM